MIEQTIAELPEGFQRSEFLLEHGLIDLVVHRREMKPYIARAMDSWRSRRSTVHLRFRALQQQNVVPYRIVQELPMSASSCTKRSRPIAATRLHQLANLEEQHGFVHLEG